MNIVDRILEIHELNPDRADQGMTDDSVSLGEIIFSVGEEGEEEGSLSAYLLPTENVVIFQDGFGQTVMAFNKGQLQTVIDIATEGMNKLQ